MQHSIYYVRNKKLPYLLLLPQVAITLIFFIWPALHAFLESFFIEDPFGLHQHFVAFHNYAELFSDSGYLFSIFVSIVYAVLVMLFTIGGGLFFALLANRTLHGGSIYKTLLIWPYAVAPAIAGILMRFLFNPAVGLIPYYLEKHGYHWNYLTHPWQALFLVTFTAVWQQLSYNFIFYLAGLQGISKSLYEAAALDGAGHRQRFWHITFPLLMPITFFLMIMNLLYAFFDTFSIIQIITQGGPANATEILVYKVYKDGFVGLDYGSSAAQSVVLMIIIGVLTYLQFKYVEKKVHYK